MDSTIIDTGERDQNRDSTLQNDLLQMYGKKLNTDVNICGENSFVYFGAHKLILAIRSPVFADIFWKNPERKTETVKIEGASVQAVTLLLWYIYADELKTNSSEELIELAKVAQHYKIGGLLRACKCCLAKHPIDRDNVFILMEAFKYFKLDFLFNKCVQFIHSTSPVDLFKKKEFLETSHDSLSHILKHRYMSNEFYIYAMEGVILWLQHRNKRDRSLLSEFDIFSFNCDEFLDLVEKFPTFFTSREIARILCNMIRPGLTELPPWCKKDSFSDVNRTFQSIQAKNYLSEDLLRRSILSKSLAIKTDCRRAFLKSYFYKEEGFDGSVIFELKLSSHFPLFPYLVMMELAFGSDYVPKENLELELFHHVQGILLKKKISFLLYADKDHYYLVLNRQMYLQKKYPFVFSLKLRATGLTKWKINGPVSNRQFRVARIPEDICYNMCLEKSGYKTVCLTPLNDWIIFIDPACGDKRPVLTSLYFNSCHKSE